jgi:hypothetical protein
VRASPLVELAAVLSNARFRACSAHSLAMFRWLLAGAVLSISIASCPKLCSGHGQCGEFDACQCDEGFFGADCSLRRCPSGRAFAPVHTGDLDHDGVVSASSAVPVQWSSFLQAESGIMAHPAAVADADGVDISAVKNAQGEGHPWAECSGRGKCNRFSGMCRCFPGYSGHACQRTDCPNACNGRGMCRTVRSIAANQGNLKRLASMGGALVAHGPSQAVPDYRLWGASMLRACVCDPGFTGADCSERVCPSGFDPMGVQPRHCGDQGCLPEIQQFQLTASSNTLFEFGVWNWQGKTDTAVVWLATDAAEGADASVNAAKIRTALSQQITNSMLSSIVVTGTGSAGSPQTFEATFVRVPGDRPQLRIRTVSGDGTVVANSHQTIQHGTREELECSGRGRCDRRSGLCECFLGFERDDCSAVKHAAVGQELINMTLASRIPSSMEELGPQVTVLSNETVAQAIERVMQQQRSKAMRNAPRGFV